MSFCKFHDSLKLLSWRLMAGLDFGILVIKVFTILLNLSHIIRIYCNGPYSLLFCVSYFILCSIHTQFSSVLSIDCKWHWGCRHFWTSCISVFCVGAIELTIRYWCTIHFKVLLCWNFVCNVTWRVGFVHIFIWRKPAVMCTIDQGLTNL